MADEKVSGWNGMGFNWWGIGLVALGVLWLLGSLGLFAFNWALAGPIFLILVGLASVFGWRRRAYWRQHAWRGWHHRDACACTCECCAEARTMGG